MKHGLVVILTTLMMLAGANLRAGGEPSVLVKTAAIRRQVLAETLTGYGTVIPDAGSTANVNLPRPGRISRLFVSAGQIVKAGAALLEFDTAAASALGYRQAASALALAREELKRTDQLVSEQLATQSQLAAARKAAADSEAALEAQRRLGTGVESERVTAPFDGVVVSIAGAQGDRIAAGATVLQLARLNGLRVQLGIEPADADRLRVGMPARITSVFDDRRTLRARVDQIHGMVNPQTQLVDAVVRLDGRTLIPGTRVRGVITVAKSRALTVPRSAVLRDSRGAYLFQVKDGRAQRVNVRTGPETDGVVAVSGDLDPSLDVVVLGNYELADGIAVRESGG